MKKYIKEIGKHSAVYTISNFLTKATGLLLIPIYTHYLTTSDYGIVANVVAIINLFVIFFSFGMEGVWSRFYFDFDDRSEDQKALLGNIVSFLFVTGFFISLGLTFFGEDLFNIVIPELEFKPFVILGIWTAFFGVFFNLKKSIFRVRQQSWQFGLFSFGRFIVTLGLIILLVVGLRLGALGKVLSEFWVWAIFFTISLMLLKKDIILKYNWEKLKPSLKYGMGILPHSLSSALISVFDRVFLTNLKGLSAAGVYTVGYQFGSIMHLIVYSINLSWSPFFMRKAKELGADAKPIFSRLTTYYLIIICFLGLSLIMFAEEMVIIFTSKNYHEAVIIVPIFVFTHIMTGLYFMASIKIFFIKSAVKYLPFITISSAILNIIFNILLIPDFGMEGAAWARFISTFQLLVTTHIVSQKFYYIKYEQKRLIIIALIGILLFFSYYILNLIVVDSMIIRYTIKISILGAYFVLLFVFKFLKPHDLKELSKIINRPK